MESLQVCVHPGISCHLVRDRASSISSSVVRVNSSSLVPFSVALKWKVLFGFPFPVLRRGGE